MQVLRPVALSARSGGVLRKAPEPAVPQAHWAEVQHFSLCFV